MKNLTKIISFLMIIMSIVSLNTSSNELGKLAINGYIVYPTEILIVFIFILYSIKFKLSNKEKELLLWVKFFTFFILIDIFVGVYVSKTYWDYKSLFTNTLALLLIFSVYQGFNPFLPQNILRVYLLFALPILMLFLPFIEYGTTQYYLYAFSLILLFTPVIPKKWRYLILIFTTFFIVTNLSGRAYVLKLIIAFLLSVTYYIRNFISKKIIISLWVVLIFSPFIFFIIALYTPFNILRIDEYYQSGIIIESKSSNGRIVDEDLLADTRSKIYNNVIYTIDKNNDWIFGRSPAKGYNSTLNDFSTIYSVMDRGRSELGILNIFLWFGLVGVILYFLIFFTSSYIAITKSNNYWAKILGLYLAFRWIIAWVEDFQSFSLNYYILMLMIGMAYSKWFREMTNDEIEIWVRGIFSKKYRTIFHKMYNEKNSSFNYQS